MVISLFLIFHAGVGLFGLSQPISDNSAILANSSGQIGILYCHSASRDGQIGRWISPSGDNITTDSELFEVGFFSGNFPSYTTLQLADGATLSAADQGVYSCVIPDENGVEQTLNIGIYPEDYSSKLFVVGTSHFQYNIILILRFSACGDVPIDPHLR